MENKELKILKQQLEQAQKDVDDAEDSWYYAKRRHYKAWEATDEIWPDETSRSKINDFEKIERNYVEKAESELNEAKGKLKKAKNKLNDYIKQKKQQ